MEGFPIRGWEPILPGVCWLYVRSQPISDRGQWGWGFHTVRGGFDAGGHRFCPQVVGVIDVWRDL